MIRSRSNVAAMNQLLFGVCEQYHVSERIPNIFSGVTPACMLFLAILAVSFHNDLLPEMKIRELRDVMDLTSHLVDRNFVIPVRNIHHQRKCEYSG